MRTPGIGRSAVPRVPKLARMEARRLLRSPGHVERLLYSGERVRTRRSECQSASTAASPRVATA